MLRTIHPICGEVTKLTLWHCDSVTSIPELTSSWVRTLGTCRMLFTDPFCGLVRIFFFLSNNWREMTICNMCYKSFSVCFLTLGRTGRVTQRADWLAVPPARCWAPDIWQNSALLFLHQLHFLVFWLRSAFHKNSVFHLLSYCLVQNVDCIKVEPWLRLGVCMLKQW